MAVLSAVLLILAFPGFEWWFTAWFAFIPLLIAIEREKESVKRSFVTGWLFGTCFFFGTCWWLTFSPITYAGFPVLLAYFLLLCVCLIVGVFPAIFAALLSVLLKRLGTYAIFATPFIWIFTEFLRFWTTGNNWNAVAYSQAFSDGVLKWAEIGGIYLVGFFVLFYQSLCAFVLLRSRSWLENKKTAPAYLAILVGLFSTVLFFSKSFRKKVDEVDVDGGFSQGVMLLYIAIIFILPCLSGLFPTLLERSAPPGPLGISASSVSVVAVQPNVPMDGLSSAQYDDLKRRHIASAEGAFKANLPRMIDRKVEESKKSGNSATDRDLWVRILSLGFQQQPKIVIFPESPMNFMYEDDKEFQEWVRAFAVKNKASVLFNAAEPDPGSRKYFNSAVMVDPAGKKVAQYDKIYLVPFGETVPAPLQSIVPALVGSFSYGKEYDLLPFGEAKGGVMICFESHFPNLSREYVNEGADVLVEMTNDGYLGPTPVLRQHLANAVFRAVETNRPLLRVTNVGISAYITERGEVVGPTAGYTEDTRVWNVSRSDGSRTFYVKYGDWFAWASILVTLALLVFGMVRRREIEPGPDEGGMVKG